MYPEGTGIFGDGRELIESGTCEAVLIAVPHFQHEPMAVAALEAGLHVLCEKPFGLAAADVDAMAADAKAADSGTE